MPTPKKRKSGFSIGRDCCNSWDGAPHENTCRYAPKKRKAVTDKEPAEGVVPAARLVVNAFFGSALINRDTALCFLKEAVEAHDNRIRATRRTAR
jgi:hypothetical protein